MQGVAPWSSGCQVSVALLVETEQDLHQTVRAVHFERTAQNEMCRSAEAGTHACACSPPPLPGALLAGILRWRWLTSGAWSSQGELQGPPADRTKRDDARGVREPLEG